MSHNTRSWATLAPADLTELVRCPPPRGRRQCWPCRGGGAIPGGLDGDEPRECPTCKGEGFDDDGWRPREQASPSALQLHARCPRAWGHCYLEGRREPDLDWTTEAELLPEPPKAGKNASAIEKAEAEAARKAWNKLRRPALGTEVHDILEAYVRQNTPGAWHPPMAWREIDWHSTAGRIAQPATDVLPDPRGLVAVYTELAVDVEAPIEWIPGRDGPWPKMPGYYDLITVERVPKRAGGVSFNDVRYRLWDYKSTSSFDWAKTEEELREDPQVLLYALHAMQTFGLQEIECNWLYLLTDPNQKPKAYVVTVTITRAEAESAVLELAEGAAEVVNRVRLFKAGKLRVVDLDRDVSACPAYGGCIYHIDKGGPCDAKVRPGVAMKQKAEFEAKIKARKAARKETEKTMALSFAQRKAEAEKKNAEAAAEQPAAEQAEAATEAPEPAESKPVQTAAVAPPSATKPKAKSVPLRTADGSVSATVDGHTFVVPAGSDLGKRLAKASAALQAAAAAFEGE